MNVTQKGLVTLLRSAVTGEQLALPEEFHMEQAYPLIRRHHISTLAYDGAVRCGVSRSDPAMQMLFKDYCMAMMKSEGQMREIQRIYDAFDRNGIDYMPLKGCNMKSRYPKPELRIMGDADILIRLEQYDRIAPIMEQLGFQSVVDSNHEYGWRSRGLYLELHKYVIPTYNKDFYAYFGNGWNLAKERTGTRYAMTWEDEFIYIFTHYAKHFRDGGIGLRHVVDLWVFLRGCPQLDECYVRRELEKLQLLEFYENTRELMDGWFGDRQMEEAALVMARFILASGSWGEAGSGAISQTVKEMKHTMPGVTGRMKYVLVVLFPGVKVLRTKYPILDRAPWLLPGIWLLRPIQKLLFDRRKFKTHHRNLELLSRENLDARRALFRMVGLDYHF